MPISQAVAEELNVRGMTRTSPVLIRIFKQEAELEVWKRDGSGRYALFKTYPICNYSAISAPRSARATASRRRASIRSIWV
jgi:murein L,D-transpeptidase YafK